MTGKGNRVFSNKQQGSRSSEDDHVATMAGDSPVLSIFLAAARHLTNRQDRHERLIKLSRDITIESKRIIFLLHSPLTKEKTEEKIIAEARDRIKKLIDGPIKAIALELEHSPAYLHSKAYTAGLQEFVEARTLCSYMEDKQIITLEELRKELTFTLKSIDGNERTISTLLLPLDYMLGLADLTGEVMRKTINGIVSRDEEECVFACDMLRRIYAGFLGLFGASNLMSSKLNTTRANLYKVEQALFAYKVRGSEAVAIMKLSQPQPDAVWDQAIDEDQGCF